MFLGRKNVLGLDFSITSTGVCVLSLYPQKVIHVSSIPTKPDSADEWDDQIRFSFITDQVMDIITRYNCGHLFIEAPAFDAYDNGGRLAQLRGVFLDRLYKSGMPYPCYVAPTKLKKFIIGQGNKSKNLMGDAVRRHYPKELQNVSFQNDDQIDAFALAKFGQVSILVGKKLLPIKNLPVYQREAIQPKKEKTNVRKRTARSAPF